MSAACRPHKPSGPSKPATCPYCDSEYLFRCRARNDVFRAIFGYRHQHAGWIYVHTGVQLPEATA